MAKYDWDNAEHDYVYGVIEDNGTKRFPNQEEISETYNIPMGTIGSHASKHKWSAKREEKIRKVKRKVLEEKSEIEASDIIESDEKFENAGEQIRRLAVKKLSQMEDDIDDNKFVRAIDILNTASSIRSAQEIIKTAQGEPSEILQSNVKSEGKYEVTKRIICSQDHINHERSVLDAASKAQGCSK